MNERKPRWGDLLEVPADYETNPQSFMHAVVIVLRRWQLLHESVRFWVRDFLEHTTYGELREPGNFSGMLNQEVLGETTVAEVALALWRRKGLPENVAQLDEDYRQWAARYREVQAELQADGSSPALEMLYNTTSNGMVQAQQALWQQIPDALIHEALSGPIWDSRMATPGLRDWLLEVSMILNDIAAADTPYEKMAAVSAATQSYHTGGPIFADEDEGGSEVCEDVGFYAFDLLDTLRNEGWEAAFGEEAIAEYVRSWPVYTV